MDYVSLQVPQVRLPEKMEERLRLINSLANRLNTIEKQLDRLENERDAIERNLAELLKLKELSAHKLSRLCGICSQAGHNQRTCPQRTQ